MSQPAVAALAPLPFELVIEDGVPMDNYWHVIQMHLLFDQVGYVMAERGRDDYFVAGDIFVYYSVDQARDVAQGRPYYRGPDFFYVGGVPQRSERKAWVAWEEGGRMPDVIIELLSPSTARIDRTIKKDIYARTFRTPEYYLYDMDTAELEGFRLAGDFYRAIAPNAHHRLPCEQLGLELGIWRGVHERLDLPWLRFFHPDGRMIPTRAERADAAEAELARLRSLLDPASPQGS